MMTHPALSPHAMLRFAIITLALVLAAPTAHAAATPTDVRMCNMLAQLAQSVMTHRQHGTPKARMLLAALRPCHGDTCDDVNHLLRSMIDQAYSVRRYITPENKGLATATFAANWRIDCVRILYKD